MIFTSFRVGLSLMRAIDKLYFKRPLKLRVQNGEFLLIFAYYTAYILVKNLLYTNEQNKRQKISLRSRHSFFCHF